MLVLWEARTGTHRRTSQCTRGAERRRRSLAAEEEREVATRAFSAYGRPLEMVTSLKCLGRVILAMDNYCPEVVRNLARANKVWRRIFNIRSREGATPWVYGFFLKAVIQAVLFVASYNWMVTACIGTSLGGFQTQVARQLIGQLPKRTTNGTWKYTLAAAEREATGFLTMK